MELRLCPECLSKVDAVCIKRNNLQKKERYYFAYCKNCGESSHQAYPTFEQLACHWNTSDTQNTQLQ